MRTLSARDVQWSTLFGCVLVLRLLYPFFDSPLTHLYSDPLRHWETGRDFLHPTIMGSSDPYLYQLWIFLLQQIAGNSSATLLTGCGVLCAAMPYGWYRALRELMPREAALGSAVLIGLRPAVLCLFWAWALQPHKLRAAMLALALSAAGAIPAGLHARAVLGYFSPLGNLYLNEIYHASSNKDIQIDYGSQGVFTFGSPSYYNPTFYPFSDWTTSRRGVLAIKVDPQRGRADWRRALHQVPRQDLSSRWRDFAENLCYLIFGQAWPDNDRSTLVGWLSV